MERYIGIDVHAASCTLAAISEKGRKLKDFPVETNGQALVEAIRIIPGHKHLVIEEGLQSLAVRDAQAARRRARRCWNHDEPRAEERQARCLWLGREAAWRKPRQASLQGTSSVYACASSRAFT